METLKCWKEYWIEINKSAVWVRAGIPNKGAGSLRIKWLKTCPWIQWINTKKNLHYQVCNLYNTSNRTLGGNVYPLLFFFYTFCNAKAEIGQTELSGSQGYLWVLRHWEKSFLLKVFWFLSFAHRKELYSLLLKYCSQSINWS